MNHSARSSHHKATRGVRAPAAVPSELPNSTLAQQKADFTAEGSPPPGKVATDLPATPSVVSAHGVAVAATLPIGTVPRPKHDG